MGNTIAVPPLDAIGPSGENPPVWMSTKLCEWYDADTAQAVLQGTKLKGDYVIDPETGALGNDLAPYARPIEGYGRVYDQSAFQQLGSPRTYMLNLWNELMTAIINPHGIITPEVFVNRATRALHGFPGVWTHIPTKNGNKRLKILQSSINNGILTLDEVQLEGKSPSTFNQIKNIIVTP